MHVFKKQIKYNGRTWTFKDRVDILITEFPRRKKLRFEGEFPFIGGVAIGNTAKEVITELCIDFAVVYDNIVLEDDEELHESAIMLKQRILNNLQSVEKE